MLAFLQCFTLAITFHALHLFVNLFKLSCPSQYYLQLNRTVEDFDDWTSWLLYKGGVGVKGDDSWESWWDEEQVCNGDKLISGLDIIFSILFTKPIQIR